MASDTATAATFLYSTLNGDAQLMGLVGGIYRGTAPEGATFPLVEFSQVGPGVDDVVVDGTRILSNQRWQVQVIGRDVPQSALDAAFARVDALLKRVTATPVAATGGLIVACQRTGSYTFDSTELGVRYVYQQADFDLLVQ